MANPTGSELLTVQGVYNNQPAATTEVFTLSQVVSSVAAIFGGGSGSFLDEGNLTLQTSVPASNPAGITNDYVLAIYSIPANSFSAAGKAVNIMSYGSFATTSNVKTVKIIFNPTSAAVGSIVSGGTTIATTGAVTASNVGWSLSGQVIKYGAAGSNTQVTNQTSGNVNVTDVGVTIPSAITANESANILVAVTGQAATTTADILFSIMKIQAQN